MRTAHFTRALSIFMLVLLASLVYLPGGPAHGFSVESTDIPEQVERTTDATAIEAPPSTTSTDSPSPGESSAATAPSPGESTSPSPDVTTATLDATATPEATPSTSGSKWPAIILGAVVVVGVVMLALFMLQKRQE